MLSVARLSEVSDVSSGSDVPAYGNPIGGENETVDWALSQCTMLELRV